MRVATTVTTKSSVAFFVWDKLCDRIRY